MAAPLDSDPRNNPLLNPPKLPQEAPPLEQVRTEHFMPALQKAIAEAREEIAEIRDNKAPATFENIIEALEFSAVSLNQVSSVFSTISSANTNDEIEALKEAFQLEQVKFGNDLMLDAKIFERVKAVYDKRTKIKLNAEQKMLLETTYKAFVRSGALLDEAGKNELRGISEELSNLGVKFSNNVLMATKAYRKVIDDEKDLAGLPERAKNLYKAAAEEVGMPGKWVIRLSPPPMDILEYCENRSLREEISKARTRIGYEPPYDNHQIVLDIVKLRQRMAKLLGFENFAAYVLDDRMAKTTKTVFDFLDKNQKVYMPEAEKFLKQVKDFAKKTDGIADFKPWDMFFYRRKLQENIFNLDPEQLRPYFDLEKVLEGVRIHAENLFNISLTETKGKYPVYHPDVKVYEVHDKKTKELIGLFYADYYARPGAKQGGAWMGNIRQRGIENGENKIPFVTNTCNFDKPTKDQPTLLSLDDVRTLFHEFGHGLHGLLAQGNYHSLTGTNVKWDFVELPSQLQENWAQQKEVLDTFARHYKTGKPMPAKLIRKIQDMANFGAGFDGQRQTFLAMLDMTWHTADPDKIKSVEDLEDGVIAKHHLFKREGGATSTSFGHIFPGGYGAGYYSYKWAEVLEADVFEPFKKKGLYQGKIAKLLRDTIYSKGGTIDPMKLFIAMMGREPDPDALFRREGLQPEKKAAKPKSSKPSKKRKS